MKKILNIKNIFKAEDISKLYLILLLFIFPGIKYLLKSNNLFEMFVIPFLSVCVGLFTIFIFILLISVGIENKWQTIDIWKEKKSNSVKGRIFVFFLDWGLKIPLLAYPVFLLIIAPSTLLSFLYFLLGVFILIVFSYFYNYFNKSKNLIE